MEDKHVFKRHNKSLLLYHFVCPVKYRQEVFSKDVEKTLKKICKGIEERYEIQFIEIGADENHVHFLLQSIPSKSPSEIIRTVKSITAIKYLSITLKSRKSSGEVISGRVAFM